MATKPRAHTLYHSDGSVWATGQTTGDVMTGFWMWFRKDGGIMRSGSFNAKGEQTGDWTTYDKAGKVYKVTRMKPKRAKAAKKVKKKTKTNAAKTKAVKAKTGKAKTSKKKKAAKTAPAKRRRAT
jgi:hypothetical protein